MHDGKLATLRDVVVHYNNGGVTNAGEPINDFLSGGIRPLNRALSPWKPILPGNGGVLL
jgi:cytochrome c peroxidase